MDSEHTPGPWDTQHTATLEWAQQSVVYAEGQERAVALVYDGEHHEANAALIAAAPDMYEALVMVEREIGPEDRSTSRKVRAALTRAGWSR